MTPLRVAAHIGVKDEIELLPHCIDHLRAIGVESFIVCDMASSDGSREYLATQESSSFTILDSSNEEPADRWRCRNADAIHGCNADWILLIDADEFPLTPSGDLRQVLAGIEADVLRIPRYNVVLGQQGPCLPLPCRPIDLEAVDLIVKAPDRFQQRLAEDPELPWIRFVPLPKVAVRPSIVASIHDGMHDVVPMAGLQPRHATAEGLLLAHVALSTYPRFLQKTRNIREVFTHHDGLLAPGFGWHWRRWLDLEERGELQAEFQRSVFPPPRIERLRERGVVRTSRQMLTRES